MINESYEWKLVEVPTANQEEVEIEQLETPQSSLSPENLKTCSDGNEAGLGPIGLENRSERGQ